jgi:aspartate/methionine/tyrosine aminotransferase
MNELDSNTQKLWADRIQPQPMFDVLQRAHIQEQNGEYLARMEIGDTPGFQNSEMHRLLAKFAGEPFRYSPSSGEKRLKDAVFASQWPDFSEIDMSITVAPANFLISAAMASVSRPGDVVYLPDPGFPTYLLAANFLNLKIVYYSSLEDLEISIRQTIEDTKLIPRIVVINNPSNPLGLAIEGTVFRDLVNYLEGSNVQLILDETYINLVYEEINPRIESNLAIRIRSFSKEHCSPGLRIGYALAPKNQSKVMSDFVSLSISCAPKFIQLAIAEYLESENAKSFTVEVRNEMKRRFQILQHTIPEKSFLARPNSAFYALIRVEDDAEAFEFLMRRNVSTCPGSKFGRRSANSLRISLVGSAALFPKDLRLLKVALEEYRNR